MEGLKFLALPFKWPQFYFAVLVSRDNARDYPEKYSKFNYFDKKNIPLFNSATELFQKC